jgi:hypothetical protein
LRQNNVRVWRICVTASEKSFLNVGFAPNFVGRFVSVPTPAIRGVAEKCLNGLFECLRCKMFEWLVEESWPFAAVRLNSHPAGLCCRSKQLS